jgi:hypothetical protein
MVSLVCRLCVLRQSFCEREAYLLHRSFYRKLNLCFAMFGFFCVTDLFNYYTMNKKERKKEKVQT